MTKNNYWNSYYKERIGEASAPNIPSQFAAFVANEFISEQPTIIELGCGNGRDSRFFANHGFRVIGVDASSSAIDTCKRDVGGNSIFLHSGIQDEDLFPRLQEMMDGSSPLVYARFFIHAIQESAEERFFSLARKLCYRGGAVAVEFRTSRDEAFAKITPDHYRRFVNPIDFLGRAQRAGFSASYFAEGFGYAKFKNDDAHVARFILETDFDQSRIQTRPASEPE